MSKEKNIADLIAELAKDPAAEHYSKPCEVLSVDEDARTCDVLPFDNTGKIFSVRLQSVESSQQGTVLFPKIGSSVMVVFMSKSRAFVGACEEVTKILTDAPEIIHNGGEFGGWFKAPATVEELNKLKIRMEAFETFVETFATTQDIASVGPLVPLKAGFIALKNSMGQLPENGEFGDELIDEKIKH